MLITYNISKYGTYYVFYHAGLSSSIRNLWENIECGRVLLDTVYAVPLPSIFVPEQNSYDTVDVKVINVQ